MKKPQMLTWTIGMFDYEFGLCLDEKSWKRNWKALDPKSILAERDYPEHEGGTTFFAKGVTEKVERPLALVTLKLGNNYSGIQLAAILCHEAVHIKQNICEYIAEQKMSDEVEAYLVQYIAGGLMEMYKEMIYD